MRNGSESSRCLSPFCEPQLKIGRYDHAPRLALELFRRQASRTGQGSALQTARQRHADDVPMKDHRFTHETLKVEYDLPVM